jgi:hypothetical protein
MQWLQLLKGQWDPNTDVGEKLYFRGDNRLTGEMQKELIRRAKGHIEKQRNKKAESHSQDVTNWGEAIQKLAQAVN